MATTPTTAELPTANATPAPATLLVHLPTLAHDSLERTLANLAAAFPAEPLLVASPDAVPRTLNGITLLNDTAAAPTTSGWVLTAADFLNTHTLAQEHLEQHNSTPAILLLGPESHTLSVDALRALAAPLRSGRDLVLPRYQLGPRDALVNSAILYPLTRALFTPRARFPLAIDLGLSPRMAQRLAVAAQRIPAPAQQESILWAAAEAALANFSIDQVPAGPRTLPAPATLDLNSVLAQVAGSLFADIELKAAFWQRTRAQNQPTPGAPQPALSLSKGPDSRTWVSNVAAQPEPGVGVPPTDLPEDLATTITPMLDTFRLAYTNLQEIWALVLPPNSLVALKKLSHLPAESFRLPDPLWVRIVYDFVLAYRLRTLNRGHLLGALTPLYLAWAASHLQLTASGTPPEQHIAQLAAAFESDKPYLVSRWRWPDRFNP